jgi:hypothetical protein
MIVKALLPGVTDIQALNRAFEQYHDRQSNGIILFQSGQTLPESLEDFLSEQHGFKLSTETEIVTVDKKVANMIRYFAYWCRDIYTFSKAFFQCLIVFKLVKTTT